MRYALRPKIRAADFILAANCCRGAVTFETRDGGVLDLKSELCKYIFLAVSTDLENFESSTVSCTPEDAALLADYIQIP